MLQGHVVYSFITLFRFPVCWFVLQSTAFCSAVGKVRNQSPGEQPDVDTDKLGLSLSICLNDIDAQVGSLEEEAHTRAQVQTLLPLRAVENKSLLHPSLLNEVCSNLNLLC